MSANTHQLSKEQLLKALQKKRECNDRALEIVESLLERKNNSDDFVLKLRDINQCHYEDIVDERHVLKLCGYPLCDKELVHVPKQQYQISTVTNKVYDITNRKKFCSAHCYTASEYIKSQILVSPLWLRSKEDNPKFRLLDTNKD